MSVLTRAAPHPSKPGTRATAFGLDIAADRRIEFLERVDTVPVGRPLRLGVLESANADLDWPASADVICTRRGADGAETFRIEVDERGRHLIWGSDRGHYVLSPDARRLQCAPGACPAAVWQRFVVGQVLPFAALVSGLEIFHASGVVLHGSAIAFTGPSGAGKTSVALSMCAAGACFLADDVLALEARQDGVVAHPGTPLAGIDSSQRGLVHDTRSLPGGEVLLGNRRETVVRVEASRECASLHTLLFLDRRFDGPAVPRFEPVTDPQVLLAATFNFVLATPERLSRLLDICARIARGRVERVVVDRSLDAPALARAIARRLSEPR